MTLALASECLEADAPTSNFSYPFQLTSTKRNPLEQRHHEGKRVLQSRGIYGRRIRVRSANVLRWNNRDVAELCRETLIATYDGEQSKAKAAANDANSSARAAENWLAADNPMSLTAFLNAYHANPTFKAWAKKILLLEQEISPEFAAQLALFMRAAAMEQGRAAP